MAFRALSVHSLKEKFKLCAFDVSWNRWINFFEELFQNVIIVIQSVAFFHKILPGRNIHQSNAWLFSTVIYNQAKSLNFLFTVSLHPYSVDA